MNYHLFAGVVPVSDAGGYFKGASHLLQFGMLDDWNQRRPLNATLFGVRLALANLNLFGAMLFQVALLAYAASFFAQSVSRSSGLCSGIVAFASMLGFGRQYVGTTLSESLGLTLGGIAVGLLLSGMRRSSLLLISCGIWGICLGMNARIGALLVIPALMFWYLRGVVGWKTKMHGMFVIAALVGISWFHNHALVRTYGAPGGSLNANFASTLLGMSSGVSWDRAERQYTADLVTLRSEAERSQFMYSKAWSNIVSSPHVAVDTYVSRMLGFISVSPGMLLLPLIGTLGHLQVVAALGLICVFTVGLRCASRSALTKPYLVLSLWVGGAIALSAPFLFADAGERVFAVTHPFVAFFSGLGVCNCKGVTHRAFHFVRRPWGSERCAAIALILIPLIALAGPYCCHRIVRPAEPPEMQVVEDSQAIFDRRSLVDSMYVGDGSPGIFTLNPRASQAEFRKSLELSILNDAQKAQLDSLPTPFRILPALELRSRQAHILVLLPTCKVDPLLEAPLVATTVAANVSVCSS